MSISSSLNQPQQEDDFTHFINDRFLDEPRSVGGQEPVCGHDVNLIGSPLFQDLSSCNKVSDIIYDVILEEEERKNTLIWSRLRHGASDFQYLEVDEENGRNTGTRPSWPRIRNAQTRQ